MVCLLLRRLLQIALDSLAIEHLEHQLVRLDRDQPHVAELEAALRSLVDDKRMMLLQQLPVWESVHSNALLPLQNPLSPASKWPESLSNRLATGQIL